MKDMLKKNLTFGSHFPIRAKKTFLNTKFRSLYTEVEDKVLDLVHLILSETLWVVNLNFKSCPDIL